MERRHRCRGWRHLNLWPMPAFQSLAAQALGVINPESSGEPCGVAGGYCREVPDVSADADPETGYVINLEGNWIPGVGGTSAAAPVWASLAALTDAYPACHGRRVGFMDPSLYSIAAQPGHGASIEDVTRGNNDDTASGYLRGLYRATRGVTTWRRASARRMGSTPTAQDWWRACAPESLRLRWDWSSSLRTPVRKAAERPSPSWATAFQQGRSAGCVSATQTSRSRSSTLVSST